ncbi:MAG: ABC transporter permease [Acutalibacteraceae bacterium]|nr:ABC transporter permease [Acutalibacteraceae bacterium]
MFQIFKEHSGFWGQIVRLAKNELIKTYKGAVIGPFWAVVKPSFTLFVYWFAFSLGFRKAGNVEVFLNGDTVIFDRFLFMLVGFIPWFFMQDSIIHGMKSIRVNRHFVTKISFPVSTIMTYTLLSKLYVHLMLCAIMLVLVVVLNGMLTLYALQLLLLVPLMFIFFLFLSWTTAPMGAFSADFDNMVMSIMTGIFWLSGIMYNSYDMNSEILNKVMLLNPINFFANGFRKAVLYNQFIWNDPLELGIFVAELVVLFFMGMYNYNRLRKKIPDVL